MNIIQGIVAVIGFILCLPFVIAWVVLAMIRGRNQAEEAADGPMGQGVRESWLGRLAQRGRVFGERASLLGRSHR